MNITLTSSQTEDSASNASSQTAADRFFEQATLRGSSLALANAGQHLTYSELADLALRNAEVFRPLLSDTRGPIAIATGNTTEMIGAALASWLLGCAYLPLDPAGPASRIEHILRESSASLLVIGAAETCELPKGSWNIAKLSQNVSAPVPQTPRQFKPAARLEDPAYIIYTSGSTGSAKGVAVTHANLASFVEWYQKAFDLLQTDRASQFASLTFDASIFEIWSHLSFGASVWPAPRAIALAPEELKTFVLEHQITQCFAPTAVAEELLTLEWPATSSLRFLLTGADTLRRFPPPGLPFQLINNYGPTECTVLATSGVVHPNPDQSELPAIGQPIPGTRIYLVDEAAQPVALGEMGEIVIAGRGVGQGYVGQPELTRERFIADLFGSGRAYRTGDLGRWRADGGLEFCGRLDEQFKIRGYRVEPNEIVHKLRAHPSIKACAVKVIGAESTPQIVAYLELNETVTSDELRGYLTEQLPTYMIPDCFVALERFPFTERGKVDMQRLPLPTESNVLANHASSDESSEIEADLAVIVSQLLKRPAVDPTDNFFRLGGHSLLAAQVIARVRQSFGVDLPLRTVFEASTVRSLAARIEDKILASLAMTPPADARSEGLSG